MIKRLLFVICLAASSGSAVADFVKMPTFTIGADGWRLPITKPGYAWTQTTQRSPAIGLAYVLTRAPIDLGCGHTRTSPSLPCSATLPKPKPPNVVPIPAAAWLFASALLGMVGIGVRGRNK